MNVYFVLMFILCLAFLIPSLLLYKEQTGWLYSFKRAKYKDKKAYSKLLGKALFCMAIVFALSGLLSLCVPIFMSVVLLVIGIIGIMVKLCRKAKDFY